MLTSIREGVLFEEVSMPILKNALKFVREHVEGDELSDNDLIQYLKGTAGFTELQNFVYIENQSMGISRRQFSHEFNTFLIAAQKKWLERTVQSLHSMCQELKLPLDPTRPAKMVELITESWNELSSIFKAARPVKPIFGPKDFLNALQALQHPNKNGQDDPLLKSSLSNLPLPTKDISALRKKYASLNLTCMQNGVDDQSSVTNYCNALRTLHSQKVLQHRSSQHARVFLQNGCPLGFRSKIWALCLNINVTRSDRSYYSQLQQCVAETDLVADQLIHKEMQLIVGNDEMYFVFCDYIYKVLLPFLRDPKVMEVFESYPGTAFKSIRKKINDSVIYPPSGVIPFHGFSMYVSPLCYLYDDPVQLYIVFRQMYMNYFHRLHVISDDPEGILSLCILFERILQDKEPELVMHLTCVGAPPWILRAFSGYLSPEQVLLLWDRILAWDSLEIIVVLAASIMSHRKRNLMQAENLTTVEAILADFSTLNITSLLQTFLFACSTELPRSG